MCNSEIYVYDNKQKCEVFQSISKEIRSARKERQNL